MNTKVSSASSTALIHSAAAAAATGGDDRNKDDVMEVIRSRFSLFKSNPMSEHSNRRTAVSAVLQAPTATAVMASHQQQPPVIVTGGNSVSSWLSRSSGGSQVLPGSSSRSSQEQQQQQQQDNTTNCYRHSHNYHKSNNLSKCHHHHHHLYKEPSSAACCEAIVLSPSTKCNINPSPPPVCGRWLGNIDYSNNNNNNNANDNTNTTTTATTTKVSNHSSNTMDNNTSSSYRGPDPPPAPSNTRLYDPQGPVCFSAPPFEGGQHSRAELRQWSCPKDLIISQNSSKRKVQRGVWLSPLCPNISYPVAVKFVEDRNARDGRSVKREIECHLFIYQRLQQIQEEEGYTTPEDAWPSAELFGYHLDRKNPGRCVLVTRKLSGPDFFDVIRQEHNGSGRVSLTYEYHKLHWCSLALHRVQQYSRLGIRHNDIKPDNIVLDFYDAPNGERSLDVKIIDLGTASMHSAKEFTGGTSWYESPEQKVLEFYSKKQRNLEKAKQVDIGLSSDVWAAGLSVTEVLVGRRVVDCLKLPQGPGPLDYKGPEEGWVVQPSVWVNMARKALLSAPREASKYTYCFDAARYIFDQLVRPDPTERGSLQDAIDEMTHQTQRAIEKSKKVASSICPSRTT